MKPSYLLYIVSLIVLVVSIYLAVEYPNSGRIQMIAGGIALIGFALNIAGFALKKR